MKKLWKRFIQYGSGFEIKAERDYQSRGTPLVYHLRMYGFIYPDGYELIGEDLEKLLKQVIKDGKKGIKRLSFGTCDKRIKSYYISKIEKKVKNK
jgi:hypothetical protein